MMSWWIADKTGWLPAEWDEWGNALLETLRSIPRGLAIYLVAAAVVAGAVTAVTLIWDGRRRSLVEVPVAEEAETA